MTEINRYRKLVDDFRSINEGNYIFACQAALPLVLTPDLLYQLWNNFKQYQYDFDKQHSYKISHIAVSDFLLSGLCREVGVELYEIEKGIRDVLLADLVLNLGEKRKNTIAAFLEDYALLEHRYTNRKGLKDIHLLTALSVLNPAEMERQIIERINDARSDAEKINYLLLHKNLLPLGLDSDLGRISEAVPAIRQNKLLSPVLIAEDNLDATGVLHVKLPASLIGKIRRVKKTQAPPVKETNSLAQQLVAASIKDKTASLDLGNCGLTDSDLAEGSPLSGLLSMCTHLDTLILSSEWPDVEINQWQKSRNTGAKNKLNVLPSFLSSLEGLRVLVCRGEAENGWGLHDLSVINRLYNLTHLDLSYNQLTEINSLSGLHRLRILLLGFNQISNVEAVSNFPGLIALDIQSNHIKDLRPLIPYVQRHNRPLRIKWQKTEIVSPGEISVNNNPLSDLPLDILEGGNEAIQDYYLQLNPEKRIADHKEQYKAWLRIVVRSLSAKDTRSVQLEFSTTGTENEIERELRHSLFINRDIVDKLLPEIASEPLSPERARALYEIILPLPIKELLKKQHSIVWVLDELALSYPWELLTDNSPGSIPFSVNAGMVRQIISHTYRAILKSNTGNTALVVGDPELEGFAPQLPSSYEEGRSVSNILEQGGFKTNTILKGDAVHIIEALFSNDYKVIHFTGHGVYYHEPGEASGILLGKNIYLTGREFSQLSTIPELVFINCDYVGKTGMATQLLEIGVKAVIVLNNTISDKAALDFSTRFYQSLFSGEDFGHAALKARRYIYDKYHFSDSGWGAYQCYGDPLYKINLEEKISGTAPIRNREWHHTSVQRRLLVARIGRNAKEGFGTGFLVKGSQLHEGLGNELFLVTCSIIISSDLGERYAIHPNEAVVTFESLSSHEEFQVEEVVWSSPSSGLDTSIVRFSKDSLTRLQQLTNEVTFYPVAKQLPVLDNTQEVYIIGHPGGREMQMSVYDCNILDHEEPYIHYRTPTEPGSSGSPVFNQQWELIGIHHAGSHQMQRLHGMHGTYEANEGIWIQSIKKEIDQLFTRPQDDSVRIIKIFISSSADLREDRQQFEIFINRKNREWRNRGIVLNLIMWEDFSEASSLNRLQDEFNKAILECDIFIMLTFKWAGQFLEHEFETAFEQFKANNKPYILSYIKNTAIDVGRINKTRFDLLLNFEEKLKLSGHFYSTYENINDLLSWFNRDLEKLENSGLFTKQADKAGNVDPFLTTTPLEEKSEESITTFAGVSSIELRMLPPLIKENNTAKVWPFPGYAKLYCLTIVVSDISHQLMGAFDLVGFPRIASGESLPINKLIFYWQRENEKDNSPTQIHVMSSVIRSKESLRNTATILAAIKYDHEYQTLIKRLEEIKSDTANISQVTSFMMDTAALFARHLGNVDDEPLGTVVNSYTKLYGDFNNLGTRPYTYSKRNVDFTFHLTVRSENQMADSENSESTGYRPGNSNISTTESLEVKMMPL